MGLREGESDLTGLTKDHSCIRVKMAQVVHETAHAQREGGPSKTEKRIPRATDLRANRNTDTLSAEQLMSPSALAARLLLDMSYLSLFI